MASRRCTVVVAAIAFAVAVPAAIASPFRAVVLHVVDRTRSRAFDVVVRYPTTAGRHPAIVFAHGFALTPADYNGLLDAWARAGYVVAAPVFPGTNAHAPGGPNEADLVNQPRDMSVTIDRLLQLSAQRHGLLAHEIDPARLAVAGQSDGGITALGVAYDSRYRDRRVRAAIVMSGARPAGMTGFPRRGPPLLAFQGTADPLNAPATTAAYFAAAYRPKFLVWLVGASHRPPYTDEQPQLGIVERSSLAFLAHVFERRPLAVFERAARRPGVTRLVVDP